jgi:hypothetical protein
MASSHSVVQLKLCEILTPFIGPDGGKNCMECSKAASVMCPTCNGYYCPEDDKVKLSSNLFLTFGETGRFLICVALQRDMCAFLSRMEPRT